MARSLRSQLPAPVAAGALAVALVLTVGGCEAAAPTVPAAGLQEEFSQNAVMNPRPRPFHGATAGQLIGQAPAPPGRCPNGLPMLFTYRGAGVATHMGEITVEGGECVFVVPGHPETLRSGAGEYTLTAANGDRITVEYTETTLTLLPSSPGILWSAPMRMKDGTGRFAEARLLDVRWHGGANLMTGETWSEFDGKIVY